MITKNTSSNKIDLAIADRIFDCAMLYLDIQNGIVKVPGNFDNGGRFYPRESFDCCKGIRSPSRSFPFSLLKHSHSIQHVAAMNNLDDHVSSIRKAANAIKNGNYSILVKLLGTPKVKRFAVEKDLDI